MCANNPLRVLISVALLGFVLAACSSRAERAQAYYEHGIKYLKEKDYVKAGIELRNAIQQKEDMLPAWKALAEINEHDKNLRALAGTLGRVIEIDPTDLANTTKLARLYLIGNAPDQALKLANAAGDLAPKDADVLALKASVLFKLKDFDGAAHNAQAALAIEPANTNANATLAAVKFSQGDSDGALKSLARIPAARQNDLGVILLKISIYNQKGQSDEAELWLRKLVELYPKVPSFRTELVRFYLKQKRPEDAIKELRSVVSANSSDVNSELQLVGLINQIKGSEAARTELVARIGAGGTVFPFQIALARFDYQQGRASDSIKQLNKLIEDAPSAENKSTAKNSLAEIYLSRNDVVSAEQLVTSVLQSDSRNVNSLRLRAAIHLRRGQADDAIADLRSALNYQPRSPDLLANLAIAYERNGAIELADKSFLDATKASNYNPIIGLNYVAFLRRRGMVSQAEQVTTDLASHNENSIPVLSALAQVKLERQDWVGAHQIADDIRRLGDKNDVADQINAAAFSGEGKVTDSLAVLQNAHRAHPDAVRPMAELVGAYIRSGQIAQAENFVNSALKDNPQNTEARVLLGLVQLAKKAPAAAEQSFKRAIKQKPSDPAGYRALADLFVSQKKVDEAFAIVRDGLTHRSDSFSLRLLQANLFELKGEYEAAINEYEGMLKDQPSSLIVINNLASLLADHRKDKASLERAETLAATLKNSQIAQFKDTLGWIDYRKQDYRSAIRLLEGAAKALPNLATVRYHLGMSYLASGQEAKAVEQFKTARALAPNDHDLGAKIDAALSNRPGKTNG